MLIIGLTGPIAGGKSAVAAWLVERGARHLDSDVLAREVVAPGTAGLAAVVERFGPEVLAPDGSLDRAALARIVFADAGALADLEAIVHPLVRERRDTLLAAAGDDAVVVVEAIKLFEAGFHEDCDSVWVVTAPREVRLERLVSRRGMDPAAAAARIDAQGDFAEQAARADEVLVNDGDRAALAAKVDAAWRRTSAQRG